MTSRTEIEAAHDTLSLINDTRATIKAQRNDVRISPVEYARRMHQADVDQQARKARWSAPPPSTCLLAPYRQYCDGQLKGRAARLRAKLG